MESIAGLPRSIAESFESTANVYTPLLRNRAEDITSTRKETFQYGSHPRQTLDIYYPTRKRRRASITNPKTPVLIFVHGGGFVRGSKTLPFADGLAHANVGHFFADNLGYTTVIPDYRLISHGARFPSGGEDVALMVDWVRETLTRQDGYSAVELFIMGNSAGGVHLATYALSPEFAGSRSKVLAREAETLVQLRGVILLSTPYNFNTPSPHRIEHLHAYFGNDTFTPSPQGLLRHALASDPDDVLPNVRTLILSCELDPEDEILQPTKDFLDEWRNGDEDGCDALVVEILAGHNHLSPPLSLGTYIDREEAWGHQVGYFIDSLRE